MAHRIIAIAAVLTLGACGFGNSITVHTRGQLGVTVDERGRPVLAVMTCEPVTPVITLSEGRAESDPDDRPNVQRGSWRARSPFTGVRTLSLATPADLWEPTGTGPGTLQAGRLFVAGGGTAEDDDADLVQVSFTEQDLAGLTPEKVRVGDGTVQDRRRFAAWTCPRD